MLRKKKVDVCSRSRMTVCEINSKMLGRKWGNELVTRVDRKPYVHTIGGEFGAHTGYEYVIRTVIRSGPGVVVWYDPTLTRWERVKAWFRRKTAK